MVWQANHPFSSGRCTFVQTCTRCGETKDAEAFGFRNKAHARRHRKCKACVAAYGREHYARNHEAYIARNARNRPIQKHLLKEKLWRYKSQRGCLDCGERDPVVLDFDHLDPRDKSADVGRLASSNCGWPTIMREIARCQLRCANCHRRRTARQFDWPMLMISSGAEAASNSIHAQPLVHRRRLRRPNRVSLLVGTAAREDHQVCRWCGMEKPVDAFRFRDRAKTQRHSICGECISAYRREHYALNRAEYIARNDHLLRRRGKKWLRRLWQYLAEHPCVDCGECDPVVLDCDHVDRTRKRTSVSFLARSGYPWSTVLAEIEKCQVRCANCHRRRTATQFDWPILRLSLLQTGEPAGAQLGLLNS
jgi:hypothetical protein